MRTLGIDLAAQPANTSVCAIDWGPSVPVAAALGLTQGPQSEADADRAVREGWIRVPTNPLPHLLES